jgi:DNA-binding IclR family transcriptional regulator
MKTISPVKKPPLADDLASGSSSLERGMAILGLLSRFPQGRTLSELASDLSLPGASVFRIATTLEQLGYVDRDATTKRFTLTSQFLKLGQPAGDQRSLSECAIEPMRFVRRVTGETTQLCCLSDTEMVIIEQLLSTYPFKYSADIGARCPLYSCAPGKAIAAYLPTEEREALINRLKLKKFTPTTITSKIELRRTFKLIGKVGYAVDRAEGLLGIHCVAAPILDRHGSAIAAITIAGPANRIPVSQFVSLGQIVMKAANKISEDFQS